MRQRLWFIINKQIMVAKNNSRNKVDLIDNCRAGFTIVELLVAIVVLGILTIAVFAMLSGMIFSAAFIREQAEAMTLATNQMEYLKSLPYDSLAVAGGSIYSTNPLPATSTQKINGYTYTITTTISYIDDAYDGCGSYPNLTLEKIYCHNYPPPSGAPTTDLNPMDYKDINVQVTSKNNSLLAQLDSYVSARVAETASSTGALFVSVIDGNGNPISGATIQVINNNVSPAVNMSDSTDINGVSIFYDLPPDTTNYQYNITASMPGYSTLTTIVPSGSLQPNYSNQNVLTQQSSSVTLTLKPMGQYSLLLQTVNTSNTALANATIYVKGGYKKYTSSSDTTYYYDNYTPTDNRIVTDSNGLAGLTNLVPGPYYFCGDNGSSNCKIGSTTYYLAAALPYGGVNPFNPTQVPTYSASNPPTTTYTYNGNNYLQKVLLMLTTSSSFPRVSSLTPYEASQSSDALSAYAFQITGTNLPCSNKASNCSTTVKFLQGSSTFTAACTGSSAGTLLTCTVNISTASLGGTQLQISANGNTLTIPSGVIGGINVTQ